jgi:hypothetical protein
MLHLLSTSKTTLRPEYMQDVVWKQLYHRDCPLAAEVKLADPGDHAWQEAYLAYSRGQALPTELWRVGKSKAMQAQVAEHLAEHLANQLSPKCLFSHALTIASKEFEDIEGVLSFIFGERGEKEFKPYVRNEWHMSSSFFESALEQSLLANGNRKELLSKASEACVSLFENWCDYEFDSIGDGAISDASTYIINAINALLAVRGVELNTKSTLNPHWEKFKMAGGQSLATKTLFDAISEDTQEMLNQMRREVIYGHVFEQAPAPAPHGLPPGPLPGPQVGNPYAPAPAPAPAGPQVGNPYAPAPAPAPAGPQVGYPYAPAPAPHGLPPGPLPEPQVGNPYAPAEQAY